MAVVMMKTVVGGGVTAGTDWERSFQVPATRRERISAG